MNEEEVKIQDEEIRSKGLKKKRKGPIAHLVSIGFTNRLGVYLLLMLVFGLLGGYKLAVMSINTGYMGQLLCYTVVFTPIGTACSIVLNSIVNKSRAENTGGDGTGIKYAAAMQDHFEYNTTEATPVEPISQDSPPI